MSDYRDRLKQMRIQNNLTIKDLAELFYRNTCYIEKIENKKTYPTYHILIKYSDLFDISILNLIKK